MATKCRYRLSLSGKILTAINAIAKFISGKKLIYGQCTSFVKEMVIQWLK